jgi:hypothetical protein
MDIRKVCKRLKVGGCEGVNKQPRPEDVVLIKPPERGRKLAPREGKLELSPGFF